MAGKVEGTTVCGSSCMVSGKTTPVNTNDVATKSYVDSRASSGSQKYMSFIAVGPGGAGGYGVNGIEGSGGGGGGLWEKTVPLWPGLMTIRTSIGSSNNGGNTYGSAECYCNNYTCFWFARIEGGGRGQQGGGQGSSVGTETGGAGAYPGGGSCDGIGCGAPAGRLATTWGCYYWDNIMNNAYKDVECIRGAYTCLTAYINNDGTEMRLPENVQDRISASGSNQKKPGMGPAGPFVTSRENPENWYVYDVGNALCFSGGGGVSPGSSWTNGPANTGFGAYGRPNLAVGYAGGSGIIIIKLPSSITLTSTGLTRTGSTSGGICTSCITAGTGYLCINNV